MYLKTELKQNIFFFVICGEIGSRKGKTKVFFFPKISNNNSCSLLFYIEYDFEEGK